jgi:Fe-S oxidoreductase
MAERIVRNENTKCSHCWLCRNVCPAYKILKDELVSPRAKNISIDAFMDNQIQIDWKYFFQYCNWCNACVAACPVKFWFDVIKAREYVVQHWFNSRENQEMLEKIEKRRNPFWEIKKWAPAPDKLYCC